MGWADPEFTILFHVSPSAVLHCFHTHLGFVFFWLLWFGFRLRDAIDSRCIYLSFCSNTRSPSL